MSTLDLVYVTRGEGPVCLVLCNIGTRPNERQIPAQLDARLKLVFVDIRGAERSPGEVADLTFDTMAEDLEGVRRRLGVERVAVLGHFLAHGRHDYVVPIGLWDSLLSRLPTATPHIFERSGHQPFVEEPDAFSDAVIAWMSVRT